MSPSTRREFLEHVAGGMLVTGLGATLAADLGLSTAFAAEEGRLDFGRYSSLVGLLQDTPPDKLQPILVKKLQGGDVTLSDLVAAASLANAETFGGEDYVGFHTEMALLPALQMSAEMPSERRPLPVLKVIYRNAERIQQFGPSKRTLRPIAGELPSPAGGGEKLRETTRSLDVEAAERMFAAQVEASLEDAYNSLLWAVQDASNVHRFVLAHRAYVLIDVVGREHAHSLLRQCVRYVIDEDTGRRDSALKRGEDPEHPIRKLLPRLLDEHKLLSKQSGDRDPGDAWVEELCGIVYGGSQEEATSAVAAALAEGVSPEVVGEAISLASNRLVLRQGKLSDGTMRTHGASPGVHASDALNAWRNMCRVSDHRNQVLGLMVAAYHTAGSHQYQDEAYPTREHLAEVKAAGGEELLGLAEEAIKSNDQGRAAAAVAVYGENGHPPRPVFDLALRYAVSEDGRLHAEKYYRTVREEFKTTRPAFRWRQLVAMARVTASAYGYDRDDQPGYRAAGYEDACRILGVEA